jgi:hypothetical protein
MFSLIKFSTRQLHRSSSFLFSSNRQTVDLYSKLLDETTLKRLWSEKQSQLEAANLDYAEFASLLVKFNKIVIDSTSERRRSYHLSACAPIYQLIQDEIKAPRVSQNTARWSILFDNLKEMGFDHEKDARFVPQLVTYLCRAIAYGQTTTSEKSRNILSLALLTKENLDLNVKKASADLINSLHDYVSKNKLTNSEQLLDSLESILRANFSFVKAYLLVNRVTLKKVHENKGGDAELASYLAKTKAHVVTLMRQYAGLNAIPDLKK